MGKQRTPKTSPKVNLAFKPNSLNVDTEKKDQAGVLDAKMRAVTADVLERLEKLPSKHDKANESLRAIRSQGSRFISSNGSTKLSQSTKTKMVALYTTALKQTESENSTLRHMLSDLQKVRKLRFEQKMNGTKLSRSSLMILLVQHAHSLPLYVGGVEGHPQSLVGAIPLGAGEQIPVGDFVAAYVENIWILAEVKSQLPSNKYEIRDIDDDASHHTIAQSRLIPLPHYRADPRRDAHALFPKDALVLALYPQTTCFYKGVVEQPPAGPTEDYQVAFEDNTFPSGFSPPLPIPQRYVIAFKEIHTRKKEES